MLKNFFSKGGTSSPETFAPGIEYQSDGIRYNSPAAVVQEWLEKPFDYSSEADLGARLAQIALEGFGESRGDHFFLGWEDVYALLRHSEFADYRSALQIPADTTVRPKLISKGGLIDDGFAVLIDGWVASNGSQVHPEPKLIGRIVDIGGTPTLAPYAVHQLLDELALLHSAPPETRTASFKEQRFGRIRKLATQSGCQVSDYVAKTIVLTPELLRLNMAQRGEGESKVVEVIPGFDEAPQNWLNIFDRLPLQDRYEVPDGAAMVRVVLSPEVKTVLAEVKRMKGRRVVGPRAEAFVRNPFGILGPDANRVIDADQFEESRQAAGIVFKQFRTDVERGQFGEVAQVVVQIDAMETTSDSQETVWFYQPEELARFTNKLARCLDDGSQCVSLNRHELEIDGNSPEQLTRLQQWLKEWLTPALWTAAEVLDLSNYSDRIEDFGEEKPFLTPVIARNDEGGGWFEENVTVGVQVQGKGGEDPKVVPIRFEDIASLQEAVDAAEIKGATTVALPGLAEPVPLADARFAVSALTKAHEALKKNTFQPPKKPVRVEPKKRLIIKRNLDEVDYNETRAEVLSMPSDRPPKLPLALRPEIGLKPHQEVGIAWLQHLWEVSPHHCRGTVLADDMGLGKTLQLLTFIAKCFEDEPDLPPALIVAPVALLNNWRNELQKFFVADALPILTLYGATLRELRAPKDQIDQELKAQGVTRLLRKNWTGSAKLVLTTYETMRDLEFALAAQPWSIMVCDEAQKIKTPAALVTRSAKKQKVRFRIACTGTPVENTLADLWCLFDFVQPGMLGALNHFSRTYRQPIEAKTDIQRARVEELRKIIEPQILHRLKTDVAKDLPVPVEDLACKSLPMSEYQSKMYSGALNTLRDQRLANPSAQLQALQAIRKICSDPHGYLLPDTRDVPIEDLLNQSPKMGWMIGRLKELAADQIGNHKVIVFCEFRELQLVLQRVIAAFFGFAPSIVNGNTSADPTATENRQQLIDAFQQSPGFRVIILSPLAVGFGVNIQAANHVIHFTRTWNPAKEDQATARAYRIGQTRTVNVYYPGVISDDYPSFDVRLDALLGKKRALASDMLNGCSDLSAADFADFG